MTSRLRSILVCAALFTLLSGCSQPSLKLELELSEGQLKVSIENATDSAIGHTETIFASVLQPDEDLVLLFANNDATHAQCMRLDQVPTGREILPGGATLEFFANLEQLSTLFCLEAGKYEMRVAHIVGDRGVYRIVALSNPRVVHMPAGIEGAATASYRLSSDAKRLVPIR